MLHNPNWTAVPASLTALAAVFTLHASQAIADSCIAAPSGAAPKGQHWYFHLDRTSGKKCWYLRETIASRGAKAVASPRADDSEPAGAPARATGASPPQGNTTLQGRGAPDAGSTTSAADAAAAADAAPAASPPPPASEPAATQNAAPAWPDPPAAASPGVQEAPATPSAPAAWTSTDTRPNEIDEPVAQETRAGAAAPAGDGTTSSVVQDLLIVGAAAALAGAVSVAVAMLRRRKRRTAKSAAVMSSAWKAAAAAITKIAVLARPVRDKGKAKPAAPAFGFAPKPERQSAGPLKGQIRKDDPPPSTPIQVSLVPEQVTMVRPFVAPRRQERAGNDRRARAD
jgi:hypothetical protein